MDPILDRVAQQHIEVWRIVSTAFEDMVLWSIFNVLTATLAWSMSCTLWIPASP